MQNEIKGRFSQKHDIEANWIKAGNAENPFIPWGAELIIYDPDENYNYARFKIGDGVTNVNDLPFVNKNEGIGNIIEGNGSSAFGIKSIARGDATHAEGYQVLSGSKSFKFNLEHEYTENDTNEGWYYLTSVEGLSDVVINETVVEEDVTLSNEEKQQLIGVCVSDDESKWGGDNGSNFYHTINNVTYEFCMGEKYYWGNEENSDRLIIQLDENNELAFYCYKMEEDGTFVNDYVFTADMLGLIINRKAVLSNQPSYSMRLENNYDFNGEVIEVDESLNRVKVTNYKAPAIGTGTEIGEWSFFFLPEYPDIGTHNVIGYGAHAEGYATIAHGTGAHAEGWATLAAGRYSHAEGRQTKAGYAAHAEGRETLAKGENTHAEGVWTQALGGYSHAEGYKTTTIGSRSHAEGSETVTSGNTSHAEGNRTKAIGHYSHVEGNGTEASSNAAHAEGSNTVASGGSSHAEGNSTKATGDSAHAEGGYSEANAKRSHAEGSTVAGSEFQHTQGKYNIIDTEGKYAHIIGNGSGSTQKNNAHTIDWYGNAWYSGDVYVGGTHAYDKGDGIVTNAERLVKISEVGYERHVYFMPNDTNETALFRFDTNNKTLTIRPIRFLTPALVNISSEIVLSYADMGYNPLFLIFDYAYDTKNVLSCLRIVKRDDLKTLTTNYAVIMSFNASSLTNPQNISFKGTYSVDGTYYNESYSKSKVQNLIDKSIENSIPSDEKISNLAIAAVQESDKYIEKDGDVSNTTIKFSENEFPIKHNIYDPGLYDSTTGGLKYSFEELISMNYF